MVDYPNFYESLPEANKRLKGTVVLYDGFPYHVLAIANHKGDDIFRVYMEPLCDAKDSNYNYHPFESISKNSGDNPSVGPVCDEYMEKLPERGVIRKYMNSPLFRKFRPFPLGFVNTGPYAVYVERGPTRRTEQGLTDNALSQRNVCIIKGNNLSSFRVQLLSNVLSDCILGYYPTKEEVFENLRNPDIVNSGVAFDRRYAVVRGPIDMLFLVYKRDIVGVFPNLDHSVLKLDRNYDHLREVISMSNHFERIV